MVRSRFQPLNTSIFRRPKKRQKGAQRTIEGDGQQCRWMRVYIKEKTERIKWEESVFMDGQRYEHQNDVCELLLAFILLLISYQPKPTLQKIDLATLKHLFSFGLPHCFISKLPLHKRAYSHFIIYNIKIQMVYFEQLRLVFLIILAYLSYRRITTNAPDRLAICEEQSEAEDQPVESLLESQSQMEVMEGSEVGIDENENLELGEGKPSEILQDYDQILNNGLPLDTLVSEPNEPSVEALDVLGELDGNEAVPRLSKTKFIKKSWRREKKQTSTDTLIPNDEQQEYEPIEVSQINQVNENQMIDI